MKTKIEFDVDLKCTALFLSFHLHINICQTVNWGSRLSELQEVPVKKKYAIFCFYCNILQMIIFQNRYVCINEVETTGRWQSVTDKNIYIRTSSLCNLLMSCLSANNHSVK